MSGVDMSWALPVLTIVSSGAAAYFGAYLRKKGENLATHEDITKLQDQVRAVTTTAKEIEAKISNEVWDRQKRWELKREVLFDVAKRVGELNDALLRLQSARKVEQKKQDDSSIANFVSEAAEKCGNAMAAFDQITLLVDMVCRKETEHAIDQFRALARVIAMGLTNNDHHVYANSRQKYAERLLELNAAVRKELGIVG